jgi:glycopeptide antibiotics resistance protein
LNPASLLLAALLAIVLLAVLWYRRRGDRSRPHGAVVVGVGVATVVWLMFLAYVTVVAQTTSMLPVRFSLVPLVDTVRGLMSASAGNVVVATAANIVLFVPLGVILGVAAPAAGRGRRLVLSLAAGVGVSVAVEVVQGFVVQKGAVTADDVIANAFGVVVGWLVMRWVDRGAHAVNPPSSSAEFSRVQDHG